MSKKKGFDCIKFKHKMAAQAWKRSGATNLREYVDFVNATAKDSSLYKSYKERIEKESKLQQEC